MAEFPVNDEDIKTLRVQVLRALGAARYPKEAIGSIAGNHGLTVGDVKSLVDPYGYPDKAEMARHFAEMSGGTPAAPAVPRLAVRPAAVTQPGFEVFRQPTSKEVEEANRAILAKATDLRVETLLNAASKSGKARTRRLGVKVHELVAELRGAVNSEAAERDATAKATAEQTRLRAEIKQLEDQVAEKKAQLLKKPARASKPAAPAAGDSDATPKTIRAWATTAGIVCPAMGRVPVAVAEAYEEAHR